MDWWRLIHRECHGIALRAVEAAAILVQGLECREEHFVGKQLRSQDACMRSRAACSIGVTHADPEIRVARRCEANEYQFPSVTCRITRSQFKPRIFLIRWSL